VRTKIEIEALDAVGFGTHVIQKVMATARHAADRKFVPRLP
jgi:hypothetical protein